MKTLKKALLLTTLITFLICTFSFVAHADTYGKLTYTVSSGEVTITDCDTSASGELIIPSTINGYPVTTIGDYAFRDCTGLTSVAIGESVTSIGTRAFYNCYRLTSITIPDSVTSIGDYAFDGCSGLTSVHITDIEKWCKINFGYNSSSPLYYAEKLYLNGNLLTDLVIPNSVTTIGNYAFYNCSGLTSITIPDSVTSIGNYAFRGCTGLTSINIPDSVTTIGQGAFRDCSGLTSVTIGESVTTIGSSAFYGCSGLTSITIPDSVTTIGSSAFYGCSGLTSVAIGKSVTSIGGSAFSGCSGLTSITIPDSVTSIGYEAFRGCSRLTSITIPDSVTSIGGYAFYDTAYYNNSNNWTNGVLYVGNHLIGAKTTITGAYTVKSGTKVIGGSAFYNCEGLTSITIPDSVTTIGYEAFRGCTGLTDVYYNGTQNEWENITIGSNNENLLNATFHFEESVDIETVPPELTYSISNGEVTITDCDTSASGELIIPETIEGYPVTTIGEYAFEDCSGLTSITIPDSVTSIGDYAFRNCSGLTQINWDAKKVADFSSDSFVFSNAGTSGEGINVVFGDSVERIPAYAFYGCTRLTSVTISDSVTSIGDWAFYRCSGLTSVAIGKSVTSIGNYAFNNCSGLTSITIPDSVTSIGDWVFFNCSGLTSVHITDIEKWCKINFGNYSSNPLYYAEKLYLNDNLLTDLVIPNSVTTIGNYAFVGYTRLTSITIPDSVTTIGNSAFYNCYRLTSITIPDSVTTIGNSAFGHCTGLTTVYYNGINEEWNEILIDSYNNNLTNANRVYLKKAIRYDANGGNNVPSTQTKQDSESIVLSSIVPTRTGYTFKGWSTTSTGEVEYNPGDTYTINESITLYAIWHLPVSGSCGENVTWTISDSVLTLSGTGAMTDYGSSAEIPWYASISSIESVVIENGITSIGGFAFSGCFNLTSITIPDSITSIGGFAFESCDSLTSVNLPDSVKSIGEDAFYNCPATRYFDGSSNQWNSITNPSGYTATCKYATEYIRFGGETLINAGETFSQNVYFIVPDESVEYLITTIKYPSILTIEEINTKDFIDTFIESETTEGDFNIVTLISQFSYDDTHPEVYTRVNPFEIVFSSSETCPLGIYSLLFVEETCVLGATDFYPEYVSADISIKNEISISGDDVITGASTYVANETAGVIAVDWSVDNEEIATIDENGVLTPKKNGTITITAVSKVIDSVYATKSVTVEGNNVTSIDIIGKSTVYDGAKYSAVIYPETASWKDIVWSVDDDSVASVTEDGLLTALTSGEVTLRATVNDGSGFYTEKTITVPSINSTIETLSSDVGVWNKEFEFYKRNYTITVPADTETISLTGAFTGGSLKCGTTSLLNGRARSLTLTGDITVFELTRSNVTDKNDSVYTITVVKDNVVDDIASECSLIGGDYVISAKIPELPENITEATVLVAVYDVNGRFLDMRTKDITAENTTAEVAFAYDEKVYRYNVMVFETLNKLNGICQNFTDVIE